MLGGSVCPQLTSGERKTSRAAGESSEKNEDIHYKLRTKRSYCFKPEDAQNNLACLPSKEKQLLNRLPGGTEESSSDVTEFL